MTPCLVLLATLLGPARPEDRPPPLLPADAVWVMRYDDKLDGEVKSKAGGEARWRLSARNDRITGGLADGKVGEPSAHTIAGELVGGAPPVVQLRQDGPKGLVCYYTGLRAGPMRIVGTWYDNRGGSGDFEMTAEAR